MDLDGDGIDDLLVGSADAGLQLYLNKLVSPVFEERSGRANPFRNLEMDEMIAPAAVDLDRDGLLDLIIGDEAGDILFFRVGEVEHTERIRIGGMGIQMGRRSGQGDVMWCDEPSGCVLCLGAEQWLLTLSEGLIGSFVPCAEQRLLTLSG
jgi:hypothetical protein